MHINKEISDDSLVQKLVLGDELALNELMKRYKYKLHSFILCYVKDKELAYDLLQEVFLKVYLKADTFKPAYKFSTWIYRIATNVCHDWSRKEKLKHVFSLDSLRDQLKEGHTTYYDIIPSSNDDIEKLTDLRQQLQHVGYEIHQLPHKLKTALILFVMEENSQTECAKLLGVTEKTIEMRVYRARKILSEKIFKNFEG